MTDLPIENRTNQILFVELDWHSDSSGETKIYIWEHEQKDGQTFPILPGESMVLDMSTNCQSWSLGSRKSVEQ